jgi:lipopolysaccharide transport system ATP-binding protein
MIENAIEAVGLSKKFLMASERRTSLKERLVRGRPPAPKTFWALKDASFSVPKGSSLGLIGQNGSGKSTALKVLTGIYRPTSGQVSVNGSVSALLEVGAGFHPELTGRENIRLNATILGFTNREIDRFMDEIIEFADIGEHIDAPLKHYSSGMYVRLGFAVAVMVRPEILIVDEVIAVGDEEFQRKCYDYLYDLRRAGTSMIIVSHGLGQITDLCDEAVWLDQGRVQGSGQSRQVVRDYLDEVNAREIDRAVRLQKGFLQPLGVAPDPQEPFASEGSPDWEVLTNLQETDLPVRPLRRGSGEMWVTGVEVLDADGRVTGILICGREATIRVHYRAEADVESATVGIGFFNQADVHVAGINNAHEAPWYVPRGLGYVDFHATPLLLAGGSYRVGTAVHVGSHMLDVDENAFELVIREPGVALVGAFLQPGDWRLHARVLGSPRR